MMKTVKWVAALVLVTMIVLCGDADAQSRPGDLAIVVHPNTPVSELSFADLRKVFLGERQYWTSNVPVVLFIRAPTSTERDAVLNVIYQMREPQFKQYWIAKIFRAEMSAPPKVVYSNESANQLVASIPGAIAFISSADLKPGVKVLKIDGHLPGETGYRLKLTSK